jgi:hypothetical protein
MVNEWMNNGDAIFGKDGETAVPLMLCSSQFLVNMILLK